MVYVQSKGLTTSWECSESALEAYHRESCFVVHDSVKVRNSVHVYDVLLSVGGEVWTRSLPDKSIHILLSFIISFYPNCYLHHKCKSMVNCKCMSLLKEHTPEDQAHTATFGILLVFYTISSSMYCNDWNHFHMSKSQVFCKMRRTKVHTPGSYFNCLLYKVLNGFA